MEGSGPSVMLQVLPSATGGAAETPPFAGAGSVTCSVGAPPSVQCAVTLKTGGIGAAPPVELTTTLYTVR